MLEVDPAEVNPDIDTSTTEYAEFEAGTWSMFWCPECGQLVHSGIVGDSIHVTIEDLEAYLDAESGDGSQEG